MILNSKSLMVIAAHPDDEVLGCGGTLLKLSKTKCKINILFVSDGVSSRKKRISYDKLIANRYVCAKKVGKILTANKIEFLSFPDNALDTVPLINIVKQIEVKIRKYKPDTVLTHSQHDLNIDHQLVHKSVLTATRPQDLNIIKKIYSFEILSSSEWNFSEKIFMANHFVDISKELKEKLKLMKNYSSELKKWPHPRSLKGIENLSRYRGQGVGIAAAEAFSLIRSFE
jgi:N-acetylglucosamine malate deacetylase 1